MASRSKIAESDSAGEPSAMPSPTVRRILSAVLVAHILIVAVTLSSSLAEFAIEGVGPSGLQLAIASGLSPYTETLYIDLIGKRYYLTFARPDDCDLRVEVLPQGSDPGQDANWIAISESGLPGSPGQRRYDALTRHMILYNLLEEDQVTGVITQQVAKHFERLTGKPPGQVRFRRHYLVDPTDAAAGNEAADPDFPGKFDVIYAARIFGSGDGIEVQKLTSEEQVAPPI